MSLRERIEKQYFNGAVGEVTAICRAELLRAAETVKRARLLLMTRSSVSMSLNDVEALLAHLATDIERQAE